MYKLSVTRSPSLIESHLAGFFDVPEVRRYAGEAAGHIHARVAASGEYAMLIDVSDCCIQSQDVVLEFQRHVASVPQARRLAVVTGSSIIRMQVRRILTGDHVRMFDDRVAALHWLTAERTAVAAPVLAPAANSPGANSPIANNPGANPAG